MGMPPRINDISTDLSDPPPILGRGPLPPRFVPIIREGYPDLGPLVLPQPPEDVLDRALSLANEQPRWTIEAVDRQQGLIHAVATTRIFRFRDDLTIRVRPQDGGSQVDMRSKSRLGVSDLGANAARIRSFLAKLAG